MSRKLLFRFLCFWYKKAEMKEPFRIFEDIYQVGGHDLSYEDDCSVYLVNSHPYLVLIDSGIGDGVERIVENIKKLNFDPERLKAIIVTHGHVDHIGGLYRFKQMFNPDIIAHEKEKPMIEEGKGTGADWYGVSYSPCKIDIKIKGEEEKIRIGKYEFFFLHIPGHSPGSIVCYVDIKGKRILFGQDIHGPYFIPGADPQLAKDSLKKIIKLDADILCEGHFGIYRGKEKVKEYIEYYLKKLG